MLLTDGLVSLFPLLRMCLLVLSVCRPGPGRAMLTADWRALGSSETDPGPGPRREPDTLIPWERYSVSLSSELRGQWRWSHVRPVTPSD